MNGTAATAAGLFLLLAAPACGSAPAPQTAVTNAESTELHSVAALSLSCSGCHSPNGGAMTSLDGRSADSLREALMAYWQDTEGTTVMHRMIRGYSEAEITAISVYLAETEQP